MRDGYIRLVVTRGVGTLGLNPYHLQEAAGDHHRGARSSSIPKKLYETGLAIVTVGTMRNHAEAVNPRIKSLNYLNNILAKIEAINAGVMECIMLNPQGYVAEASGDNVFVVQGDDADHAARRGAARWRASRATWSWSWRAEHGLTRARGRADALRSLHGRRGVPDRHGGRDHQRGERRPAEIGDGQARAR